jgi:hypothetical protein
VCADAGKVVKEARESNNCRGAGTIYVRKPPPPPA